jgi:hypothetical protein
MLPKGLIRGPHVNSMLMNQYYLNGLCTVGSLVLKDGKVDHSKHVKFFRRNFMLQ